jgi:alkylation response protein AidB-like acyl-CoA dehydrogenase
MLNTKSHNDDDVRLVKPVDDLVAKSLLLRAELGEAGRLADIRGDDTPEGLMRCFEEGLNALSVPARFGGRASESPTFGAEAWLEIVTNLSATDAALGQNWLTTQLVAREIFNAGDLLPLATRSEIARMILEDGTRFVASNSETGSPAPVTYEKVDGGIIVTGVKTFNSNSGGGGYAKVGIRMPGATAVHHALIPLDGKGVRQHRDWDNMGQRGTCSQTITYDHVFVPDGWHYLEATPSTFLMLAFLLHGALVLGSGFGALDTGLQHLRDTNRVTLRRFASAADDPLSMRRVGLPSAKLNAALAYQRQVSRQIEHVQDQDELREVMIEAFRSKTVATEAGLEAASGLFELTGARTTANKYRYDRFWRNARTFSVHDLVDVLYNWIGGWELEKRDPDLFVQYGLSATGGI